MDTGSICGAGYEAVASKAIKALNAGGGGALCVYRNGVPVVDLWSGSRDTSNGLAWERETMGMAWSTTKGIASTVIHMLADRGQLDYDSPVARYWPEFAAAGKDVITVRHLLTMEAGLYDIRHLIDEPTQMLDHDRMASALAAATPAHPPGQANGYHALTYGWLLGEVVRRVTSETLGAFVQTEIAEPLVLDGCYIGTPRSEIERVAARPELEPEPARLRRVAKFLDPATSLLGFSPKRVASAFLPQRGYEVIPRPEFLQAEVPAANGVFTARSLARIYAALASDDGLDGVRLWSPETRRAATRIQNRRRDLVIPLRVRWLLGYHRPPPVRRASPEAFGFYGAYGSGAYADPARQLAVGFVVREARGAPLVKLSKAIAAATS
ncbi:MAG: serine hydrolase domain-containing protein [Acidimicrobiales bacterium]